MALPTSPRFGVEEEFLVIDPATRNVAPLAGTVVAAAKPTLGDHISGELTELQLETRTGICTTVTQAHAELTHARTIAAAAARANGVRVIASGTPVLAGAIPPPITKGDRQDQGNATFRGLHDDIAICALHIHVEVPDRDLAVAISNRLRPWLPVLSTLTANSPFWSGRDTGYASWRNLTWTRWPVAGPPPVFESAAHYDATVARMLTLGALVDTGTVFWDIRPSASHPTLEIRVADVPPSAWTSAMYAGLVRALVVTEARAVEAGTALPRVPDDILRTACWRAARDGLTGHGVDTLTGDLRPAAELATRLLENITPTLREQGEHDQVVRWFDRLLAEGSGEALQRAAHARRGDLADVVDDLVAAVDAD